MPRGRSVSKRDDAVPASDIVEAWQKHPEGDTEGEDNSHLPPLPLPTVTEPRRVDEQGRVQWTVEELVPKAEDEVPEEEPGESEGPAPSLGPTMAVEVKGG
jgi:hypothetical protein